MQQIFQSKIMDQMGSKPYNKGETLAARAAVVERPLGNAVSKADAGKTSRLNYRIAVICGFVVVAAGLTTAVVAMKDPIAPHMDLPALWVSGAVTVDSVHPGVQASSADPPVQALAMQLQDLEVSQWPKPQTVDEAFKQIALLKDKLNQSDADAERAQMEARDAHRRTDELEEGFKAQVRRAAQAQVTARQPQVGQDPVVALSVLEVNQERVVVVDRAKPDVKFAVAQGARLPGGAVFIGFDPQTWLLKTDQGEFLIR